MNNYSIKPKLIEPRVKYYLHHKLKRDHDKNVKYFTSLYNIKLFGIFVSILGGFIFYKYKMMPEVIEKKKIRRVPGNTSYKKCQIVCIPMTQLNLLPLTILTLPIISTIIKPIVVL